MPVFPYMLIGPKGNGAADEWLRLGVDAHGQGKVAEADRFYRKAMGFDPRNAVATHNLAVLQAQTGALGEALMSAERATILDSGLSLPWTTWALIALDLDMVDVALSVADRAYETAEDVKDDPEAHAIWLASRLINGMLMATAGMAEKALTYYREVLESEPKHPWAGTNMCFVQTLLDLATAECQAERKRWRVNNGPEPTRPAEHANVRDKDRPLRVGYVGGDFKQHSASMIFGNVVLNHTKNVEVYIYSSLPVDARADGMTKRFLMAAGWDGVKVEPIAQDPQGSAIMGARPPRWRDVSALNDDQAAQMVRADAIDVLVDLAAHTAGGRLGLFMRKPAPVQATAWGFAHGTGCSEIDWFLADPVAVPKDERQYFAEGVWDLPSIVTYLPPTYSLKYKSLLPYHRNGYITFGSFGRFEKYSVKCFQAFRSILKAVPSSRLELKDASFKRPYAMRWVLSHMEGIDPSRILLSQATSHEDHLRSYQGIDLFLSPFPHSSGVVSAECLWMGVPYLTLCGGQPAGRTGASLLHCLGLQGTLVADDVVDYVSKAVWCAKNPTWLGDMRKDLHQKFADSPAVKGYVLKVEDTYRGMWKLWCDSNVASNGVAHVTPAPVKKRKKVKK